MSTEHADASGKSTENVDSTDSNKENLDVIFIVEGKQFRVKRALLSAKSERFRNFVEDDSGEETFQLDKTSAMAFKIFHEYILTDMMPISTDNELSLQVLVLAVHFFLTSLASHMVDRIETVLDVTNVIFFINEANNHDLGNLRDVCHSFIDENALALLSSNSFGNLTEESLIQIIKRESFLAPEIEIFKSVAKWSETNNRNVVSECVRLSHLTISEIMLTVWPTKLVSSKKLLDLISEIDRDPVGHAFRVATTTRNENFATVERGATVTLVCKEARDKIFFQNPDVGKYVKIRADGESCLIVRLNEPFLINYIILYLYDEDDRYYSYYVETSLDQSRWRRIIDYSHYACRAIQKLFFDGHVVQYIKIVGTRSSTQNIFHIKHVSAFYTRWMPEIVNGVIRPKTDVATTKNKTLVSKKDKKKDWFCPSPYTDYRGLTFHEINENPTGFIIQLSQPYLVSSMRLLLARKHHVRYKYFIETSINKTHWELLIDKRNQLCGGWQDLRFDERIIVFIKIVGTESLAQQTATPKKEEEGPIYEFVCSYFECPSETLK